MKAVDQGRIQGGGVGAIAPPPKTYESNLFHQDFAQFGKQHSRLLGHFDAHCFVPAVLWKYISFLLQQWTGNETWLPNITDIAPLNLLAGSAPAVDCKHSYRTYIIIFDSWNRYIIIKGL